VALSKCTTVRRPTCALVAGAVVVASLGVASSGPAWGQDAGDADGAPTNPFPANTFHAFLLDDGEFTTIDPPGASGALTAATGINDHGQVVGYYFEADGITAHGFLRDEKRRVHHDRSSGCPVRNRGPRHQQPWPDRGRLRRRRRYGPCVSLRGRGVCTTINVPGAGDDPTARVEHG
jgi:hypothetical protein